MQLDNAIIQRIKELLEKYEMSEYALRMNAGIAPATLSNLMNGINTYPRIDTLLHICEGFNLSLKDFFDSNLFDDVKAETHEYLEQLNNNEE